jgi:hypothetical protein
MLCLNHKVPHYTIPWILNRPYEIFTWSTIHIENSVNAFNKIKVKYEIIARTKSHARRRCSRVAIVASRTTCCEAQGEV